MYKNVILDCSPCLVWQWLCQRSYQSCNDRK